MKALIEKINTDPKEKEHFIEFMHIQEEQIKDYCDKCNREADKFVVNLIKEFAKKEGMELKENEIIRNVMIKLCKSAQEQVYRDVIKQFNTFVQM